MSRTDIEHEIVDKLGKVPPYFASMPDEKLELEWKEYEKRRVAYEKVEGRPRYTGACRRPSF